MDRLTNEEVLHVATLARLELNDDEIEKYAYQLKEILNEIDKINDIELESDEIMIAPWDNDCVLREDNPDDGLSIDDVLRNAPKKFDRFVEVRGVFDE